MAKKILVRRGLEANRTSITPLLGEIIWTTDNHDLWIGDGSTAGGIKVTGNVEGNYIPLTQRAAANGVATLDASGLIPNNQLPALAITSTYTAASQAAQLALTVQEGDVCVRTDENKSYIALNATNGSMSDWQELLTPTDSVTSVNGQTGVVSLDTDDITEGTTNLYYTDTRVNTYLTGTATLAMLSDVNISSIADGEVITWSTANSRWENNAIPSGVTNFVGLSDTPSNFTGSAGYVLRVNAAGDAVEFNDLSTTDVDEGTNLYYTNARADARIAAASIDDLSDVDTSTSAPSNGEVLKWDGTNWVPGTDDTVQNLEDLSDVTISSIADGEVIHWSTANSRWENTALTLGSTTFVGLSDTPANYTGAGGQFLKVNSGATAVEFTTAAIDDLSDVDTTTSTPNVDEILGWDGTNWVPGANIDGGTF